MKTEFIWVKNIADHPQYYIHIFGVKEISKALGVPLHTSDCDEWLLAVINGELAGFSGYKLIGKNTMVVKRSFVFEKFRKNGIYSKMLDFRIARAKKIGRNTIECVTTEMSRSEFKKRKFNLVKQQGKYQTFRLKL